MTNGERMVWAAAFGASVVAQAEKDPYMSTREVSARAGAAAHEAVRVLRAAAEHDDEAKEMAGA
jgi:hypothetical protein